MLDLKNAIGTHDVLFVTLDTLRYDVAAALVEHGLKVERVEPTGHDVAGVVVAKVVDVEELTEFKKPIRWVTLDDGTSQRQVICGATNFSAGDVIAYARPPAVLPGGLEVTARTA
jgi:phenylalanyl-tRNA synthetase beta chain